MGGIFPDFRFREEFFLAIGPILSRTTVRVRARGMKHALRGTGSKCRREVVSETRVSYQVCGMAHYVRDVPEVTANGMAQFRAGLSKLSRSTW